MNKAVYSLVLSEDVVAAIDRVAASRGTNRSNLINQILADYVSCVTPEKRMHDIFSYMEGLLDTGDSFQVLRQPSDSMLSLRSALAFKYNPTVRYSVELYRTSGPEFGELRVSLRTQNAELALYMMQFFKLWMRTEEKYLGECEYTVEGSKFCRRLVLRDVTGEVPSETIGGLITAYIGAFDSALKAFFYNLDDPAAAAREVDDIFSEYMRGSDMVI